MIIIIYNKDIIMCGCLFSKTPDENPTVNAEMSRNRFRCCIDSCDNDSTACLCCVTIKLSKDDLKALDLKPLVGQPPVQPPAQSG